MTTCGSEEFSYGDVGRVLLLTTIPLPLEDGRIARLAWRKRCSRGNVRAQSEVIVPYDRPFPRLRPLHCLAQRGFPLLAGVVPSALVRKDCVGNFEGIMSSAKEAGGVPGTVKLLRCGFADRAKDHGLSNSWRPSTQVIDYIA
jgi:hypothetical protein